MFVTWLVLGEKQLFWRTQTNPKISPDPKYSIFDEKRKKNVTKVKQLKAVFLKILRTSWNASKQLQNNVKLSDYILICTSGYLLQTSNQYFTMIKTEIWK